MIHTEIDFFNKVFSEVINTYFAEFEGVLPFGERYHKAKYSLECFSNGVLSYDKMIKQVAKACKCRNIDIHNICDKFVKSYGTYKPRFNKLN